jgi:hypothetical protein
MENGEENIQFSDLVIKDADNQLGESSHRNDDSEVPELPSAPPEQAREV